ncbi:MAG: glutamate racemase [Gammaproteobacteria bacterium]|nr:glutamate racemase [Gammaproteobacteria bacterium]
MSGAIGVFDSGVGGLTVLRALRKAMPDARFTYLGDTARLPYGTKSAASVVRYAGQAADALLRQGLSCLVVACNTASAIALEDLRTRLAPLPVVGVVEPGARAAVAATRSGRIAVIATEGTVRAGAYDAAIRRLDPAASVTSAACPLFVALAEEGWTDGDIPERVAHRYLEPLLGVATPPDVLLLGCTHFPVLAQVLARVAGPAVRIVDSAATTAAEVAAMGLAVSGPGSVRFEATDGAGRFARVGAAFLGEAIREADVTVLDLGAA